MTNQEFYQTLKTRLPNSDFTLDHFTASRETCTITCNKCKRVITCSRADSFLQRARDGFKDICKYCDKTSQKVQQKDGLIYKLQNANPDIECLKLDFSNREESVQWHCKKCNFIFERTPAAYLKNCKCPHCENKRYAKLTPEIIRQENKEVWGDEYTILSDEYHSNNTYASEKILVKHNICGFCWSVNVFNFLKQQKGCPRCAASKPEKTIRQFLKKYNYDFKEQFPVNYSGHVFRYDFVINNIFIEFHGQQHYMPVKAWGGEEGYKKRVEYDNLKKQYCEENNYSLIILQDEDLNNLDMTLAQRLNKQVL